MFYSEYIFAHFRIFSSELRRRKNEEEKSSTETKIKEVQVLNTFNIKILFDVSPRKPFRRLRRLISHQRSGRSGGSIGRK